MLGILIVILIVWICYTLYWHDYFAVKKVFRTLEKTWNTRDLLVLKLAPEIKDEALKSKVVELIDTKVKNKNSGYTEKIKIDILLNESLKEFYDSINKNANNPVVKATLSNAIELEKILKKIRKEYNEVVEKYNMNLVMHKFVCIRIIHMKPLDTYAIGNH